MLIVHTSFSSRLMIKTIVAFGTLLTITQMKIISVNRKIYWRSTGLSQISFAFQAKVIFSADCYQSTG